MLNNPRLNLYEWIHVFLRLILRKEMEVHNRQHHIQEIQVFLLQSRLVGNVRRSIDHYYSFLCKCSLAQPCIPWNRRFRIRRVRILLGIVFGILSEMGTNHRCCRLFSSYIRLLVCIHFHLHKLGTKLLLLLLCKALDNCGRKKDILLFLEMCLENRVLQFPFLGRRYHFCPW